MKFSKLQMQVDIISFSALLVIQHQYKNTIQTITLSFILGGIPYILFEKHYNFFL